MRRYLEVGARHGDTFYEVMRALPKGSLGVAIDLPGGPWGTVQSVPHLEAAADALRSEGYEIAVLYGDSSSPEIADALDPFGAFDAILIDGDHRYEGVSADWRAFRSRAPLVAFHDIAGAGQVQPTSGLPVEVPVLWREILAAAARAREIVAPGSTMGIGVVWP